MRRNMTREQQRSQGGTYVRTRSYRRHVHLRGDRPSSPRRLLDAQLVTTITHSIAVDIGRDNTG